MINNMRTLYINVVAILKRCDPRGFTLIETLVAVLILTTSVVGPLSIASRGLTSSLVAKDQIVAFYLAQDAVEYVRFMRDSNKLAGNAWLTGLNNCISADGSVACYVDSRLSTVNSCGGTTCANFPLYYDSANNYYTYSQSATTRTIFTRTITIKTPIGGSASEAQLDVVVSWSDTGTVTRQINVFENLLDWQ